EAVSDAREAGDSFARRRGSGGGCEQVEVTREIRAAVVRVEEEARRDLILESRDSGAGVHGRELAVGLHDHVRTEATDVTTAAVAPERVEDEVEARKEFQVCVEC